MHGHRVARAARRADRTAQDEVARDHEIGGQVRAERRGVGLDPGVQLGAARGLHLLHAVARVFVEHEHREQPAHVRADRRRTAEVVERRIGILREDRDVMAGDAPLAGEFAGEDVGAGAREQVPVPDVDPHSVSNPLAAIISGIVTNL